MTIQYKKIRINRKSKPIRLEVTDGVSVVGDAAVQLITKIFGPVELFDLCCYYKQIPGRCPLPLFDSSNKQRLSYLSHFAFHDRADPVELIEKIAEKRKEKEALLLSRKADHQEVKLQLREMESQHPIPEETFDWLDEGSIIWFEKKRAALQTSLKSLEEASITTKQLNQQRHDLEKKISARLEQLRVVENDDTEKRRAVLMKELEALAMQERYELRRQLNELGIASDMFLPKRTGERVETLGTSSVQFTERDCYREEMKSKERNQYKLVCRRLGIEYSPEAITARIKRLRSYIEYQQRKTEYEAYQEVATKLDTLTAIVDRADLGKEITNLEVMKRSRRALHCPHCQKMVYYTQESLSKADVVTKCSKDEIREQENLVKRLETRTKKLDMVNAEMKFYERKGIDKFKVDEELDQMSAPDAEDELNTLTKVKFIEESPISVSTMRLIMRYAEVTGLEDSLIRKKEESAGSPVDLDEIRKRRLGIEDQLSSLPRVDNIQLEKAKCESAVAALREQLNNVIEALSCVPIGTTETSSPERDKSIERIAAISVKLEQIKQAKKIKRLRIKLKEKKALLDKTRKDVKVLGALYENALHEHRDRLEQVVKRINGCIASVIHLLFSYPISIGIRLTEPKEGKRYKYSATFDIVRKGIKKAARNIEEAIAGGEVQRVVLAVIIALNKMYKSPLLLLDELFSSIEQKLREASLESIRKCLKDRLVVCAEHFAEEGDYDQCVKVSHLETV